MHLCNNSPRGYKANPYFNNSFSWVLLGLIKDIKFNKRTYQVYLISAQKRAQPLNSAHPICKLCASMYAHVCVHVCVYRHAHRNSWFLATGAKSGRDPGNSQRGNKTWPVSLKGSPLEEMATHSSILAWRIPWTEESGGLQFMESQRVGHD